MQICIYKYIYIYIYIYVYQVLVHQVLHQKRAIARMDCKHPQSIQGVVVEGA